MTTLSLFPNNVNIFDACFSFYLQVKFSFTSSLQSIYIKNNLC